MKLNVEIPIKPSPELLALSNPYDPNLNKNCGMHDLSLYKGKYYLYFGIVPALIFYSPYKLIFGSDLPDGIVVLTFCFGAFFFSVKILEYLKNTYFKGTPDKIMGISLRVLGFGSFIGALLRSPDIYEVAVSGGLFFLTSAIYFLLKETKKDHLNKRRLLLISFLLGLGCGCRPQIIIIGVFLILSLILRYNFKRNFKIGDFFAITLPFICFLVLIGFYNFIRFDNPFDFGLKYQLISDDFQNSFFSFKNLMINIYFDWFHPIAINTIFPFVHVNQMKIGNVTTYSPGILFALPFTCVSFIYFFVYLNQILKNKNVLSKFPIFEFLILLIPPFINIIIMLTMHGLAVRFLADFSIFLIITNCMIWFYFDYESNLIKSTLLNKMSITLAIVSMLIGIAISIENPEAKLTFPSFNKLIQKIKI